MYLFLAQSLAHFPISIYTIFVLDQKEGETQEELAIFPFLGFFLSRLSFSRVFSFYLNFCLFFGAVLEDPSGRGYLVTMELSFGLD